jgi:4-amino-4-deoxy-L-arabinose transferase-like glycosyltransferase
MGRMDRLTRYHALALMVLCLLVAAALRFPDLSTLPPGVHYDEAANGVLAGDIGLRGDRPIFISSYTGKETLFFYVAGGLMALVGESVFTLRLTAAFIGVLTVAATYWLGREMLADRRIALLAAAFLAVSFWHVLFSRLGFRAISEPLLQALTVAALFRGLRTDRWAWFVAAGVLLGLTGYTYLASRLFPVVLIIAALPLLFDRPSSGARLRQLALTAGVAALVFLPLAAYFVTNPGTFWTRIDQVGTPAAAGLTLGAAFAKSLGMFFLVGDPYLRFNLPGRPLFDFVLGALLVVGWLVAALRLRRLPYDWQRSAVLLLLAAPLIMLLPTALAVNEIVPSNLRALGMIPFVFFLPAIGLVTLLRDVERRLRGPSIAYAVQVIVPLVLIGGGALTAVAYFQQWGREPELVLITDGDLTAAAPVLDARLAGLGDADRPTVYVAAPHYRHPTLAFLSANYDAIKWLPQSQAVVFPAAGPALYLFPANSPLPDWAAPYLAGATATPYPAAGRPLFTLYETAAPAPPPAPAAPLASFEGVISLLSATAEPAPGGDTLPVTLTWRVDGLLPPDRDLSPVPFVHLEDVAGFRWAQAEADAYPAEQWTPGETIIQRVDLPLPDGVPPGDGYTLRVGLFDPGSGERLAAVDNTGAFAGTAAAVPAVGVLARPVPQPLPVAPEPINKTIVDGLRLMGTERPPRSAEAGQTVGLALWWLAETPPPDLSLRLSLVDAAGEATPLLTGAPVYDTYPFAAWTAPAFVIDRQLITIPEELPGGDYTYRLELLGPAGDVVATADLGTIAVAETARLFSAPPMATPLDAQFGADIRLLGYDLAGEGREYGLTLVWQAINAPPEDLTVFVHLLRPDGTCCAWQSDAAPQGGAYPTSRWVAGEVVIDIYGIVIPDDAPPGEYALEVGLYRPETGARLPLTLDGAPAGDALRLQPIVVP